MFQLQVREITKQRWSGAITWEQAQLQDAKDVRRKGVINVTESINQT